MKIRRAIPVIKSADLENSRSFYVDFLGFEVGMDDPGFLMLKSISVPTSQLIIAGDDAADTRVLDVDISVEVDDVEGAYEDAGRRGLDIVYPLTDEPWGIRRFFLRDPNGLVINVAAHRPPGSPR